MVQKAQRRSCRRAARDLKNATQLNRYDYHAQRVREGDGVPFTVAKARLLSHAEYRAAEGFPHELKSLQVLEEGRFVALRLKADGKAVIRCAEVVSVDRRGSGNEVEVWYYLDRRESSYNDFEMPLHERTLVPEYYGEKNGMAYLAPSKKQIESGELPKRRLFVLRSEVGILAPKWTLLSGGKVAAPTCVKSAKLMRSLAVHDSEVRKVVRKRYD